MGIIFDPTRQWLFSDGNWKKVEYKFSEPYIEQPIVSLDNRFIACKKNGGWVPQPPEKIENKFSRFIESGKFTDYLKEYFDCLSSIEVGYFAHDEMSSNINKKHQIIGEISGITSDSEYYEAFWNNGTKKGILRNILTKPYGISLLSQFSEMSLFEIEMRVKLSNPLPKTNQFEELYQKNLNFLNNGEETRAYIAPVLAWMEKQIEADLTTVEMKKERLSELQELFNRRFSD